jgi:hypothetical protein
MLIKPGLEKIETNGIFYEDIKYEAVKQLLEITYAVEIPSDVCALSVGLSTMPRWAYESVFRVTDSGDESKQVASDEVLGGVLPASDSGFKLWPGSSEQLAR